MWGGNIPSTLAGEFAFSLGFALAVLFMGVLHRAIERRRGYAWAGLLVADHHEAGEHHAEYTLPGRVGRGRALV